MVLRKVVNRVAHTFQQNDFFQSPSDADVEWPNTELILVWQDKNYPLDPNMRN